MSEASVAPRSGAGRLSGHDRSGHPAGLIGEHGGYDEVHGGWW